MFQKSCFKDFSGRRELHAVEVINYRHSDGEHDVQTDKEV